MSHFVADGALMTGRAIGGLMSRAGKAASRLGKRRGLKWVSRRGKALSRAGKLTRRNCKRCLLWIRYFGRERPQQKAPGNPGAFRN